MTRVPVTLTDRQGMVLRAVVAAWVGNATPVGSKTLSHWLPVKLSAASVRSTLAELEEQDLLEKPHTSAGRVPTERGMRVFVDALMSPGELPPYDRRWLAEFIASTESDRVMELASQLLSEQTRQLGFVLAPRLEHTRLQHVTLVRVSTERLLVVLVSQSGQAHRRLIPDRGEGDRAELERIAGALNEHVAGRTLAEVRERLGREASELRRHAGRMLQRALDIAERALTPEGGGAGFGELVIATRLALLDQPEFRDDPERLRELFAALETREELASVIDRVLQDDAVSVAFGAEADDPKLRGCALVVAPYGAPGLPRPPLGALGVIGPRRMDFARVVPLVQYLSRLVTEKIGA